MQRKNCYHPDIFFIPVYQRKWNAWPKQNASELFNAWVSNQGNNVQSREPEVLASNVILTGRSAQCFRCDLPCHAILPFSRKLMSPLKYGLCYLII